MHEREFLRLLLDRITKYNFNQHDALVFADWLEEQGRWEGPALRNLVLGVKEPNARTLGRSLRKEYLRRVVVCRVTRVSPNFLGGLLDAAGLKSRWPGFPAFLREKSPTVNKTRLAITAVSLKKLTGFAFVNYTPSRDAWWTIHLPRDAPPQYAEVEGDICLRLSWMGLVGLLTRDPDIRNAPRVRISRDSKIAFLASRRLPFFSVG